VFTEKDKGKDIAERLVRIGYRAAGLNAFTFDEWKASGGEFTIPHYATPAELKNTPNHFILDVRAESEAKESHLEGSVNIPFAKIPDNVKFPIISDKQNSQGQAYLCPLQRWIESKNWR
jgi:hypothetical protein